MKKIKPWLPVFFYAILAFIIILPLLDKGYIFCLDNITPPAYKVPTDTTTWRFFYQLFLAKLNLLIPSYVIEKTILFLIIFFSGWGMHKLIPTKSEWPKYFAGIFYIFNPFFYSRFMVGQWMLLLAYGLTPFAIKSYLDFMDSSNWKNALKSIIWTILITFINLRNLNILIIFVVVIFLLIVIKTLKNYKKLLVILTIFLACSSLFLFLSYKWLFPLFNADGKDILNVDETQVMVFKSQTDEKTGLYFNLASLYGFWGDSENHYINQKVFVPAWPLLALLIFILVTIGVYQGLKNEKTKYSIIALGIVSVIGFLLAIGINNQFIYKIDQFFQQIFFIEALREPQKFIAILCLNYAYLGALGFNYFLDISEKNKFARILSIFTLLILPVIYSPGLFWGSYKQLKTANYPNSWSKVNTILNEDKDNFNTLVFPWHRYMSFSFTNNRVIENPAPIFFSKPIISGDNLEMGSVYTQSVSHRSQFIKNEVLDKKDSIYNLGDKMLGFNVKYILLLKQADWQEYSFISRQNDLELVFDDGEITLYKSINFK